MTNEIMRPDQEARNIADEAETDAGFMKMLKFKKGDYWCDGEEIALGTQLVAHAVAWTKAWIKFENRTVVERRIYRISKGEHAPERDRLVDAEGKVMDADESFWPMGINGKPADPWVYQYLLPMESKNGEVRIFVASSFGGRRAVADVCSAWGRRRAKQPNCGQPIIKLEKLMMPTRNYGDVPRPYFEIIGWDEGDAVFAGSGPDGGGIPDEVLRKQEFQDEIPF